ncbi:MAG: hypothetical protein ACR2PL_14915 [Dehalococcoidia bacterium]
MEQTPPEPRNHGPSGDGSDLPPMIAIEAAVAQICRLHEQHGGATFNLRFGDLSGARLYG